MICWICIFTVFSDRRGVRSIIVFSGTILVARLPSRIPGGSGAPVSADIVFGLETSSCLMTGSGR